MNPVTSPFATGVGSQPPELAGRDELRETVRDAAQARFLTHALHQAQAVALRVRTPISVLPSKRDLKGLKDKAIGKAVWELDYRHVATTIQEKPTERPYFPKMLMAVEAASELVMVSQLFRPDMPAAAVQSEFLRSIRRTPELPGEIRISETQH